MGNDVGPTKVVVVSGWVRQNSQAVKFPHSSLEQSGQNTSSRGRG